MPQLRFGLPRLGLLASVCTLLASCGGPERPNAAQPTPPTITALPSDRSTILTEALLANKRGFYSIDPASGAVAAWQLQGHPALNDTESYCAGDEGAIGWRAATRELFFDSYLGCTRDTFLIGGDGNVRTLPLPQAHSVERHSTFTWSPDLAAAAFFGVHADPDAASELGLFIAEANSPPRRIAADLSIDNSSGSSISWSPDGSKLAFVRAYRLTQDQAGDTYTEAVYLLDVAGGGVTRVSPVGEGRKDNGLRWSPDGQQLVYWSTVDYLSYTLVRVDANGSGRTELMTLGAERSLGGTASQLPLHWSPDGRYVAFIAQREHPDFPVTVWRVDTRSGEERDLLTELIALPDGQHRAYRAQLYAMVWSPDGSQIAISSPLDGYCRILSSDGGTIGCTSRLYLLPADGGALRPLTTYDQEQTRFLLWVPAV